MLKMENNRWLIWVIALVAVILSFGFLGFWTTGFFMPDRFHGGMMWGYNQMGFLGWLLMSLAFVALILFSVWIITQLLKSNK
jgi:uncharacterized membrane protein